MPRAKSPKVDKYVSDEKLAEYNERSYAEITWLTTRYLQHVLPPAVTAVLTFVIHRTMRYHKDEDAISLGQFVHGIIDKDTERLLTGACGYSKSTVTKALSFLEELQLISRTKVRDSERGNAPTLVKIHYKNVFFLAKTTVHQSKKDRNMARLNLAKRFKENSNLDTPPCPISSQGLSNSSPTPCPIVGHTQSDKTQSENTQSEKPSAPSGRRTVERVLQSNSKTTNAKEAVQAVLATVVGKGAEVRERRVAEARASGKVDVKTVNLLWKQGMSSHYHGAPFALFTVKSFGILKKAMATHFVKDVPAFIEWAIGNWAYHREHSLQWYKDGGARLSQMPDAEQFARLYKHFVRLYAEHCAGAHRKVGEIDTLKARVRAAEHEAAKAKEEVSRITRDADAALRRKDEMLEAAHRDALRAIHKAKAAAPRAETRTMEEVQAEFLADTDDEIPEWRDGQ